MSIKSLYEKIKSNNKNVSFDDIHKLMIAGGFNHRCKGSSHNIYTHPDLHGIEDSVTIPYNRPIKRPYIKKALEKFDLVNPDFNEDK